MVRWADDLESFATDTGAGWAAAAAAHGRALDQRGVRGGGGLPRGRSNFTKLIRGRLTRPALDWRTASCCAAPGRRVDSRALLRTALETFDGLGGRRLGRPGPARAAGVGGVRPPTNPSTVLTLTAQEQQVAQLVKQGLSNRDVAARLFVSPRTVEYHLSNVVPEAGRSLPRRSGRSRAELTCAQPPARGIPVVTRGRAGALRRRMRHRGNPHLLQERS